MVFGISSVPATLLLRLVGVDFLEGDFWLAGTLARTFAGGTSILCAGASVAARRTWANGGSLGEAL